MSPNTVPVTGTQPEEGKDPSTPGETRDEWMLWIEVVDFRVVAFPRPALQEIPRGSLLWKERDAKRHRTIFVVYFHVPRPLGWGAGT